MWYKYTCLNICSQYYIRLKPSSNVKRTWNDVEMIWVEWYRLGMSLRWGAWMMNHRLETCQTQTQKLTSQHSQDLNNLISYPGNLQKGSSNQEKTRRTQSNYIIFFNPKFQNIVWLRSNQMSDQRKVRVAPVTDDVEDTKRLMFECFP